MTLECTRHRPPRSPQRKGQGCLLAISKVLSIASRRQGHKRNWAYMHDGGMDLTFWDGEGVGIPRLVVRLPHVADGSDAVAAALRSKRRRLRGGTPTRPEDSGTLQSSRESPCLGPELSQVLARAMFRREVAERASAAAAAAEAAAGGNSVAAPASDASVATLVSRARAAAEAVVSADIEVMVAKATDAAAALVASDAAARAVAASRAPCDPEMMRMGSVAAAV